MKSDTKDRMISELLRRQISKGEIRTKSGLNKLAKKLKNLDKDQLDYLLRD